MLRALKTGKVQTYGVVNFNKAPKKASGKYMLMFFIKDESIIDGGGVMVMYFKDLEELPRLVNGNIVYVQGVCQSYSNKLQIKATDVQVYPFKDSSFEKHPSVPSLLLFSKTQFGGIPGPRVNELTLLSDFYADGMYNIVVQIKELKKVTRNRAILFATDYSVNPKMINSSSSFKGLDFSLLNCVCWDQMALEMEKFKVNDLVLLTGIKTKFDNCGTIEGIARNSSSIALINVDDISTGPLINRKRFWYQERNQYVTHTKITNIKCLPDITESGYYRIHVILLDYFPKYLNSAVYCFCSNCSDWSNLNFGFGCQQCNMTIENDDIKYSYQYALRVQQNNKVCELELSLNHACLFFGCTPSRTGNEFEPDPGELLSEFKDIRLELNLGVFYNAVDGIYKICDTICFNK